nr:hypothetical protein [Tanacetum cinerariifolium]
MELLSPQVVFAAKLPILNPNEFDLWKMRIEQYFLMTDYSLWEVILNGDSLAPTRVVEDNDDLKKIDADDLEEMDLKWQMAMLTMRARRFLQMTGRNLRANGPTSLGFDMFKVECYNFHRKGHFARECRSLKDSKRNGAAEPQRRNVPSRQPYKPPKGLWSGKRVRGSKLPSNEIPVGVEKAKAGFPSECSPVTRERSMSITWARGAWLTGSSKRSKILSGLERTARLIFKTLALMKRQADQKLYEEPTNDALMAFSSLSSSSDNELPPSSLYDRFQSSYGYHVVPPPYTGTFMPLKPNLVFNNVPTAVETDHSAFTVKLSPTKPVQHLSLTNRPSAPIIKDWVSDSKDESKTKTPQIILSFVQSIEQVKSLRHFVQHVETSILAATPKPASPKPTSNGKRRNRKACFVCKSLDHLIKDYEYHDKKMAQPTARNHAHMGNHQQYAPMTHQNPQKHMVPATVFTQSKPVPITVVRIVSTVVPKIKVTRPKQVKPIVTKTKSPIRRHINRSPSPKASNSPPIVIAVKALVVNVAQGLQGKLEWKPKCLILDHVSPNTSASITLKRFDYNDTLGRSKTSQVVSELNGGYIAFGGNLKGGKISGKRKIKTGKAEEVNTACYVQNRILVTKPHNNTPYELLHGRTPSIGFIRPFSCPVTILNTLDSLGKFDRKVDEGFLVGYSISSKAFRVFNSRTRIVQETLHVNFLENKPNVAVFWFYKSSNTDGDVAFDGKEPEFDEKKPEFEVIVSPSSSAQSKKQDDKTKREAKGKKLEDITYSDDEDDIGAEADFNNLETSITISPFPTTKVHKDHHVTQIIEEPKRVHQALKDPSCIKAMQEELLQFKMQKVWVLVDLPYGKRAIGTKWVFRNKKDERGIVVRNKAKLVAQGHTQEEGINYEEVFTPVARIEAIRLFLTYASFMGFMVHQMDVKSALLYRTIEEEVYVCQPPGFEDPNHPDKVYKVVNALYGLHQAPRAWYETLANYLLENGFQRGKIDQTLFIKRQKGDILLVQIYVADIIFGATNRDLCKSFEKLMKDKFHISSMGELTFFLDTKSASTPIDTEKPLLKDPDEVNTPRCDEDRLKLIELTVFFLPKVKKVRIGVSAIDLQVSAVRLMLLLSIKYALTMNPNIYVSCIKKFWTTVDVKKVNDVIRLQALVDKKKVVVTEATIRDALRLDDAEGVKCLPNEEIFCMSAKRTSWKEFSSSMASAVICLSSGDLSTHTTMYTSHVLTQKVFTNMRRVGKGFYGVDTPLFEGKLVEQQVVEEGNADENDENVNASDVAEGDVSVANAKVPTADEEPSIPSPTPPTLPPQPS